MLQKTIPYMRQSNLIGGEWVQADSGATIDVVNPATGLKLGTVPKAGKAETRRAIAAADEAFRTWKKTSVLERHKLLRKLHDAIMDNQQTLADNLEQWRAEAEGGLSIVSNRLELLERGSAAPLQWFAGVAGPYAGWLLAKSTNARGEARLIGMQPKAEEKGHETLFDCFHGADWSMCIN